MMVARAIEHHIAVARRINVIGRDAEAAMPVAGAFRRGSAACMHHAEIRGEGGVSCVLHGDFDDAALAGALALV